VPASYFFRIKSEIFSDPAHNKKVLNFMGYGHKSRAATENLNLIKCDSAGFIARKHGPGGWRRRHGDYNLQDLPTRKKISRDI